MNRTQKIKTRMRKKNDDSGENENEDENERDQDDDDNDKNHIEPSHHSSLKTWNSAVWQYMALNLTFPSDKPVALSGSYCAADFSNTFYVQQVFGRAAGS